MSVHGDEAPGQGTYTSAGGKIAATLNNWALAQQPHPCPDLSATLADNRRHLTNASPERLCTCSVKVGWVQVVYDDLTKYLGLVLTGHAPSSISAVFHRHKY
ncbi:hypothetical protein COCC4DRAFT_67072 [Bipolaris maydis ATCC 48331]|uniref:Uncharacterized protein n=2 Tax=Cochliobolus heterostrophus TaxID=5016 RepID=M2UDM6_COCH5|nr:uncharacterized protein COCC4DRAFT_67072 [Bipolaris maydis ATCC 48331]EMD96659.1 hypothetical protein COCHEDRAFT_1025176 [Bipolaris maydis C5]ENH98775.1 hypothetical protein COCC4DRAFT_67072 [Bipolaris maydis ATCC 48331]